MPCVLLHQGVFFILMLSRATAVISYVRLGRASCASQSTAQLALVFNSSSPDADMSCAAIGNCTETDCEEKCNEFGKCTGFTFSQDRFWDPQSFHMVLRNGQCLLHSLEVSDYTLTACGLPTANDRKCFMRVNVDGANTAAQRRRRFYSHYCPDEPPTYKKVSYERCPQGYMLNYADDAGTPCQGDAPQFDFVKRCELSDCETRCNELHWCIGFTVSIAVSKFGGYTCLFHSKNESDLVSPDQPCGMDGGRDCQCWMKPDDTRSASSNSSNAGSTTNFSVLISMETPCDVNGD